MKRPNLREFFRVSYTYGKEPLLDTGRARVLVLNASEAGLRLALEPGHTLQLNDECGGWVMFRSGTPTVAVRGVVVRITESEAGLRLMPGGQVPLATIVAEQRHQIRQGTLTSATAHP